MVDKPLIINWDYYMQLYFFTVHHCPKVDDNPVWCKDCEYRKGKCTHPKRPQVRLIEK
jgi:hypothetical protein